MFSSAGQFCAHKNGALARLASYEASYQRYVKISQDILPCVVHYRYVSSFILLCCCPKEFYSLVIINLLLAGSQTNIICDALCISNEVEE